MHRFWSPLAQFCRDLEMELGHPTQVNGYVTPPGSQGFDVHADAHDVFVLQAFGRKHWEVHDPGTTVAAAKASEPQLSVELGAGDSLYIPKGAPHAARTQSDVSGHLTVGILTYTWSDLLREVMSLVEDEETFKDRLPLSFHRDEEGFASAVETKLDELSRWIEKLDPNEAASMMVRKFLTSRPSQLMESLQGLLETNEIRDDSVLRRRPRSILHLQIRGDSLRALLGDRELQMPARLLPVMEQVEERQEFRVRDLSPWLDPEGRLVLARRLIREGVLEPTPSVEH
jgi:cupin superfamily protein